jgi:hypothetical protein
MATNYSELLEEMKKLDGTQGEEFFMVSNGFGIREYEYEFESFQNDLPKRIAKKGWIANHKVTWTYLMKRNRFGEWALYRTNQQETNF